MGLFFHPGNAPFRNILADENYVDRTGIIAGINRELNRGKRLICLSLPRRNGKTWMLRTLYAYYDDSCDSSALFDGLSISRDASYREHMNRYITIRLDMAVMMSNVMNRNNEGIRAYVENSLKEEALRLYPDLGLMPQWDINTVLSQIVTVTGKQLFFFLDEWDAPIRMCATDPEAQAVYLDLLRSWFKNETFTDSFVAGAYMTGILPIKKIKGESALSDFREYTILSPGFFAPYIGFHDDEVRKLCEGKIDFQKLEDWYEGYTAGNMHYFNPYAVILAIEKRELGTYWPESSSAETLTDYLKLNYDGLQEAVVSLIGGGRILVRTSRFQNDTVRFSSRDDVLTLLIHLGYLSYERITEKDMENWSEEEKEAYGWAPDCVFARIPNKELLSKFRDLLNLESGMPELIRFMNQSVQLLKDTVALNSKAVAEAFHRLHSAHYAPGLYNNEQSLRSLIRLAYIAYLDHYYKLEEVPGGKGIADIVFIPRGGSQYLPMIVELKWNRSANAAISQILRNTYHAFLAHAGQDVLFVGVNYNPDTGEHACKISRIHWDGNSCKVLKESEMCSA